MRALVLEEGNYSAALSAVRALGRLGHEVAVAAPFETPASSSRWCGRVLVSPAPRDAASYADFLARTVGEATYDIAFVCDDAIIEIVSRTRAALPRRPDFLLPPRESLQIARNKVSAQRFAAALGIPTPRTLPLESAEGLDAARGLGFPLVIKGDQGSGGTHVRYGTNPDEMRRAYDELTTARHVGRPMAQEFIPGDGYLTQVLYHHGQLVALCSHRKVRQFPVAGGVTAKGVTVDEPQLDAQAERIFSALEWHGPAKADFKRDRRDGLFKLMELDPRLTTTLEIAEAAGVNMIERCCLMAVGGRVEPRLEYRKGVAVRYLYRDLLCLATRPALLPRLLADAIDPRVRSDFDWRDLPGDRGLVRRGFWHFESAWRGGQLRPERGTLPRPGSRGSRLRRKLDRLAPALIGGSLLAGRALYRGLRLLRGRGVRRVRRGAET